MSKNKVQEGKHLTIDVGGDLLSGAPFVVGGIAGVLMHDADTTTHIATIDTEGVYALSVKGVDGSGNAAVAIGDALYWTVGDTPQLNKKTTGALFGYALATVGSGATATINVLLAK